MLKKTPTSTANASNAPTERGFMATQRSRFIPKAGYNLVGPDDFHPPCDDLYFLAHYATRAEAEAAREKLRGGGERALIFGPDGD